MWRWLLVLILALHGLIHTMGFAVYLRFATIEGLPYPTTLLGGALAAPAPLVRVLGILWLVTAIGFLASAGGTALAAPWWRSLVVGSAAVSLALCLLGWPAARAGVFVNLALLAIVLGPWTRSWP